MSESLNLRLDEIALIVDCEHKTAPIVESSDFYSVRTSNISKGKIDYKNCNRVDEDTYLKWSKRTTPQFGDIVLAREAPVGEVGFIEKGYNVCLGQRTVLIRVTSEKVNKKFLLYYLINPINKNELVEMSAGSVVEHLNMRDIRSYEILLPPLTEQKAIASVLSSLDDKIDLLHRQNTTLEALAETLFRQWFVEEAKEEWEEGTLGDLVVFNYGKTLKEQDRSGMGFPVYGSSGVVGYHSEYLVEGPGIITGRKGTLGVINYSYDNFYPIDTTFFITSRRNSKDLFFEYLLLKILKLQDMNSDSAVPGLNRNIAHNIPITVPPVELCNSFNLHVNPLFNKIRTNHSQIDTLIKLRDTLLPKLMSGEVRVALDPQAEPAASP